MKENTKLLKEAEDESIKGLSHAKAHALKKEVYSLLSKEECMWRQRARLGWIKTRSFSTKVQLNVVDETPSQKSRIIKVIGSPMKMISPDYLRSTSSLYSRLHTIIPHRF